MIAQAGGTAVAREETAYLFIDGGYLRPAYTRSLEGYFGPIENPMQFLDFGELRSRHRNARKVFYYDAHDGEEETEALFQRIQRERGYHVRLGVLQGAGKGQRQKEVDIRLAVDMLTHAVNGNMSCAYLLTGDRDFRPLVDALVGLGLNVTVLYDASSVSQELLDAADEAIELCWHSWYQLTDKEFRKQFPIPYASFVGLDQPIGAGDCEKIVEGNFNGKRGAVWKCINGGQGTFYVIHVPAYSEENRAVRIAWNDLDELRHFFERKFGPIVEEAG